MKIYDANGMCWIWDQQLGSLYLIGDAFSGEVVHNEYFDNVEQAVQWLNDSGYMEE